MVRSRLGVRYTKKSQYTFLRKRVNLSGFELIFFIVQYAAVLSKSVLINCFSSQYLVYYILIPSSLEHYDNFLCSDVPEYKVCLLQDKIVSFRKCVVCENNDHTSHYCSMGGYDYVKCDSCGLIYINELEQTSNIYKAYSGGFWKSLRRRIMAPFRQFSQVRDFKYSMQRARAIVDFSLSHINKTEDTRNYLDIGCNKGFLLATAIEDGWNVYGEELVPELTVPFCNTYPQFQDQIYNGRFADVRPEFRENMFDLITAIDVIEHFEDPVADLRGILEILKPGGVFVIQTPDVACEQAHSLKCEWGALKPLEHLNLFDVKNLETLANRIGFTEYQGFEAFEEADGNFVAVMKKLQ